MRRRMRLIGTTSSRSSPAALSGTRRPAASWRTFAGAGACDFAGRWLLRSFVRFDVAQDVLAAEAFAFGFDVGGFQTMLAECAAGGGRDGDIVGRLWPVSALVRLA